LLTFCKAKLEPGFDLIARITGLESAIIESDLVITGEGCIDSQTLEGKAPAGVAALARRHGRPVIALGGTLADHDRIDEVFDATCSLVSAPIALECALAQAAPLLRLATRRAARLIRLGQGV
jgi:glycerate kinase